MKNIDPKMSLEEAKGLPALCGVTDAAKLTGYSEHFLSDACARGDIKAVKFGRRWRIDTAALLRQFGLAE